jgi:hypothetical protein
VYIYIYTHGIKAFNKDKDGESNWKNLEFGKFKFLNELDRRIAGLPKAGTKYQAVGLSNQRHFLLLWNTIIIT